LPTSDVGNTIGRLIDFDHAKVIEAFAATEYYDVAAARVPMFKAMLEDDDEQILPYSVDDEVVIKAVQAVGRKQYLSYLPQVMTMRREFFNLGLQRTVTCVDLHWDKAVGIIRILIRMSNFLTRILSTLSGHWTATIY
jgi:hypothetical protein